MLNNLSRLITESYITEVSRWKNEVASGNLSPESIKRLKRERVAKTPKEYAAGLRKGTENIAKQTGFDLNDSPMKIIGGDLNDSVIGMKTGGAYTNAMTKTIRAPKEYGIFNKITTPLNTSDIIEREIAARHEADEAKYYKKLEKEKLKEISNKDDDYIFQKMFGSPSDTTVLPMARLGLNGNIAGQHNSMRVIGDEAPNLNFYNNLFGSGENLKIMRDAVEDKLLKKNIGVGYGDINFQNKNKINSQIKKYEKEYVEPEAKRWYNRVAATQFNPLAQAKIMAQPYSSWDIESKEGIMPSLGKVYKNKIKDEFHIPVSDISNKINSATNYIKNMFKK